MADETPAITEVTDVQMAFPGDALDYMPAWEKIPDEFKTDSNEWVKFAHTWFRHGLSTTWTGMLPAEGFDPSKAHRQLTAIINSYAPKHEHKIACVAYLASCWFVWITYCQTGIHSDGTDLVTIDHAECGEEFLALWVAQQQELKERAEADA